MSKKCLIEREKKRVLLFKKYYLKRLELKKLIKNSKSTFFKRELYFKFQSFPRNSNINRQRKRCFITGRSRGYNKIFNISRIKLREKIMKGEIFGLTKSSW